MLDFPLWLRATHFLNLLFISLLVRSGLEILSAHPKLYWNDDCTPGSEWLRLTRKRLPAHELWTSRDEEDIVLVVDRAPRTQEPGPGSALALSRRCRLAAHRSPVCRDALRHARMAPIDSHLLVDSPGRLACPAVVPGLSSRRHAGTIQPAGAARVFLGGVSAVASRHRDRTRHVTRPSRHGFPGTFGCFGVVRPRAASTSSASARFSRSSSCTSRW